MINMAKHRTFLFVILPLIFMSIFSGCHNSERTDILIAGGGTSGIAAGIQAARMGVSALIAEEHEWLGGMLTSAGVSAVDGNYNLQGGLWKEFRDSLSAHYGADSLLRTGWVSNVMFEPSVGNRIFNNIAKNEPGLSVFFNYCVETISKRNNGWSVVLRNSKTGKKLLYKARFLIDATELGDVASMCGAAYDIGMDSRYETGEDIAPEHKNNIVQDLTYVAILKKYDGQIEMPKPDDYDSSLFACCCINPLCVTPPGKDRLWPAESMITYGKLPGNKYMINWPISGNDFYANIIEMNRDERNKVLVAAKNRTLGFIFFIREQLGFDSLYLADDEFPTADRLPFIPYHRESRRIRGKVRFTVNHITHPYDQPDKLYRTCIAVGDYPVDHHHSRYTGKDTLPDLHFYPVPSYGLPLGVMIPETVNDLIVAEKSISVTNLVNGTTRLQPVVLQIGQAAGALAALAVIHNKHISDIEVREVQNVILETGGYLLPYLDVPPDHLWFKPMQRIGSTGIMKSVGKNVGWSNQTFFRAEELTLFSDLEGLNEYYSGIDLNSVSDTLTIALALDILKKIAERKGITDVNGRIENILKLTECADETDTRRPVLRGEMALMTDILLDPFNHYNINIRGEFKTE